MNQTSLTPRKEYKTKRGTRSCEYLWSSASNFLRGVRLYNSNLDGDLEGSFSVIYKAWEQLWQADRKSIFERTENPSGKHDIVWGNGEELKGSKGHNYSLTDYLNTVMEYDGELDISIYTSQHSKTKLDYTLEKKQSDYNLSEFNGYDYTLSIPFFSKVHHKKHPALLNLFLVKEIRNFDQHARLEDSNRSSLSIHLLMNPYITANFNNYLIAYEELYIRTKEACGQCGNSPMCNKRSLYRPEELMSSIQLPVPVAEITGYQSLTSAKEESEELDRKNRSKGFRLQLSQKITEVVRTYDKQFEGSSVLLDEINKKARVEDQFLLEIFADFYKKDHSPYKKIITDSDVADLYRNFHPSMDKFVMKLNQSQEFKFQIDKKVLLNFLEHIKRKDKTLYDSYVKSIRGVPLYNFDIALNIFENYNSEEMYKTICRNPILKSINE